MKKKTKMSDFIFRAAWMDMANILESEQLGELIVLAVEYGITGKHENPRNDSVSCLLEKVKDDIDRQHEESSKKYEASSITFIPRTMEDVIEKWIAYKKERRQSYKPKGFEMFKKRLFELSGGNVNIANAIIEQSMANNYAGIFKLKQNQSSQYGGQQKPSVIDKVADILE